MAEREKEEARIKELKEILCETCKIKKGFGQISLMEHHCEAHNSCLDCAIEFEDNFSALEHLYEKHHWKIKCKNASCNFMSLSADELKKHEEHTHIFIDNKPADMKCHICRLEKDSGKDEYFLM